MTRLRAVLVSLVVTLTSLVAVTAATTTPAHADECYTWSRNLSSGATGADVSQLQIRVAGWAGYGVNMAIDGSYGPQTVNAVKGFQAAYGLGADGVAGPATYAKIYALQDADCTPLHFSYAEVDGGCGAGGYSGGSVPAATVKENLKRAMWRAEALRQRIGDRPLTVTSGLPLAGLRPLRRRQRHRPAHLRHRDRPRRRPVLHPGAERPLHRLRRDLRPRLPRPRRPRARRRPGRPLVERAGLRGQLRRATGCGGSGLVARAPRTSADV